MGHYKSNLRDLEFNLFEVFRVQDELGQGAFEEMHLDTARDINAPGARAENGGNHVLWR